MFNVYPCIHVGMIEEQLTANVTSNIVESALNCDPRIVTTVPMRADNTNGLEIRSVKLTLANFYKIDLTFNCLSFLIVFVYLAERN